jgi:hypothetical protein
MTLALVDPLARCLKYLQATRQQVAQTRNPLAR